MSWKKEWEVEELINYEIHNHKETADVKAETLRKQMVFYFGNRRKQNAVNRRAIIRQGKRMRQTQGHNNFLRET